MQHHRLSHDFIPVFVGMITSRFKSSIRTQLTLFTVIFVAIVVGLAAGAVLTLRAADRMTEELDQKWLTGTGMLGELSDRVSEFRIAEGSLGPIFLADERTHLAAALEKSPHGIFGVLGTDGVT